MRRTMFHAKLHRAVITHADLDYEGSVTIDADLLDAADMLPHESVHIWNVTRGTRLQTYTLPGPRGSGTICVNGAAAHHNQVGDLVILATFVELEDNEARTHVPRVVRLDPRNRIVSTEAEQPGPTPPRRLTARTALHSALQSGSPSARTNGCAPLRTAERLPPSAHGAAEPCSGAERSA